MNSPLSPAATAYATFLFTDIEGSTRLVQELGAEYPRLLDDQRRLIGEQVRLAGGRVFGSEGDALFAAFPSASGAIAAAAAAQRDLEGHDWPHGARVRVRMGIHTGEATPAGDDYVGLSLHQVARITSAGHGGQVLLSEATRQLAAPLPAGLELRDMGEHRLKDLALAERLYQLVGEDLADEFPPLKTLNARPNNLPVQLTSFVGREELAAARQALDGTRLLTLTGPGGTGKTRMALQVAAEASDGFPDGVYFVALESIREPDLVPSVIASTIGMAESAAGSPLDQLVAHLRDRRVLLVLDNFEQVVEAGPAVARLLRDAPEVKVIVTTRIGLRVSGEQEFPVPPLGLAGTAHDQAIDARSAARSEAVLLFVERAMAVQPSFALTDENAAKIVEITRRLDGLPLAIELAAARIRVLPVEAIAARLDQRLSLLTGGARDLPARQQTLRGAIDWSYDLLDPPERRLFERFGTFAGGAFLTEAEQVCTGNGTAGTDALDGLSSLADKSLVRATPTRDEDPRFAMLVTIREYALERLDGSGEVDLLGRRHAFAFLTAAERSAPELTGRQAGRWLDRLGLDHDNLRQAIDWACAHAETETALRFIVALWRYWQIRGHLYEGRELVDRVTAMPGVDEQPPLLQAAAFAAAGGIAYWQADTSATHRYYSRELEAARRSGDRAVIAKALYDYGFASLDLEDVDQMKLAVAGRTWYEQSLALYRELGDAKGIADASWALASALSAHGDLEGARRSAGESLEQFRQLGDPFGTAWALFMLAGFEAQAGDIDSVPARLRESLSIFRGSGDQSGILLLLAAFGVLAHREGDVELSMRLGGAVEKLRIATGAGLVEGAVEFDFRPPVKPTDNPELLGYWEAGAGMSIEQAVAYALGEPGPAEPGAQPAEPAEPTGG